MKVLAVALLKRNLIELRRYPLQLVGIALGLSAGFLVIFLGLRAFGGRGFTSGDAPSVIGIGYVLFFLMQIAYQELTSQLTNESLQGTLEQLALSRPGLLVTLCMEFFVNVATYLVAIVGVFVGVMLITGRSLRLDPVSLVPLLVLTLASVGGIGLALGGLTVVFKRIQPLSQFMQLAFIGLLAAPVERVPLLKALPVALGYNLIQDVMVHGASIFQLPPGDLLLLVLNAAGYMAIGAFLFSVMDRKARERGLLGTY